MSPAFAYVEHRACVCGAVLGSESRLVRRTFSWGDVTFRKCPKCGTFMQSPRLSASSLAAWYDSPEYSGSATSKGVGYINYELSEPQRLREARFRYQRDLAGRLRQGARVLEIGSASGTLPSVLKAHGHQPIACDLSERFAEMARAWYGIETYVGDWLEMRFESATLDAVIMLGTVSNLSDLPRSLQEVRRILKPGGFLFFNFPAADSAIAKLYGERMWMFTPSIMQFLTRKGVGICLANAGLQVETMASDFQAPTLSKFLGHARLGAFYSAVKRLGLAELALPFPVPLPGIMSVCARVTGGA